MGNRLKGRVALVTGGGGGIGRGVCQRLAAEGCSIVVNDLGGTVTGSGASQSPADTAVADIKARGGAAIANYDSVSTYDGAAKMVQAAVDQYGRLDILCHAAGILRDRMVFNMAEEEWDSVLRVHLYGAFNVVRHAVPHMIKQRYGRIVIFSSVSALGNVGQSNYTSAKAGQIGFGTALAREVAPYGITVNMVLPGGDTRMTVGMPESSDAYKAQWGTPSPQVVEDLRNPERNAPKIVYLCTEAASNITGQVISTFGLSMSLYSPRRVSRVIHKDGPWTLDELDVLMPNSLTEGLVNPAAPPKGQAAQPLAAP
ncbi:MAG: SDR family NAD(P)-dependent oxidoreductase [Dehalococcoidia bacterium]|nr:SDR family NAD(P)-dependent oxidoreductase [Dehalococcoidia bacterium]